MKLKYQMRGLGIGIMVTALLMGVATKKGIPLSDAEIRAKALELGMVDSNNRKLTDVANESAGPEEGDSPEKNGGLDAGGAAEGDGDAGDGTDGIAGPRPSDGSDGLGASSGTGTSDGESVSAGVGASSGAGASEGGSDSAGQEASGSGDVSSETDASDGERDLAGSGALNSDGAAAGERAGNAVQVVIEFGMTSDHVSEMLEEAGLVEDAAAFDEYLCSNGLSRKITAGTYEFASGVSEEEIIRKITGMRAEQPDSQE